MASHLKKNSRILVTGAAGFVGARVIEACAGRGYSTVSVDAPSYFTERKELQGLNFGEIVDRESLFDWLTSQKPQIDQILHLGACTDTMELDEDYLMKVNFEYSMRLFKYATQKKIPFVYASSAATYGEGELGYDDAEELIPRLQPLNPYGKSKQLFDLWAIEQERRGETPPAWAGFKFFNVYGFGERHKGRMASVVLHSYDQIRATGRSKLFKSHRDGIADGYQKRDFIYVEDVVEALFFAANKPIRRGIYNLGTGTARPFLDLARAVFAAMELPEKIDFVDTPEALRARYQYFTEAKMTRLRDQGFTRPFTSLEDGVRKTIERLRQS